MEMLREFLRDSNKDENKINFEQFIKNNRKLFSTNRNSDFVEALMEFALVCKPKDPICHNCCLNKICKYSKSRNKINSVKKK